MLWSDTPIHLIDFEGNLTSGILEYGVVTIRGGEIVSTSTRVCGAIGRIRSSDTAIHGITQSAVAGHRPFADEFERFAGLRESGPLGAHYAQAENSLIRSVWPYSRTARDFSKPGGFQETTCWGPWVDTGVVYTELFRELPSGRLEQLVTTFQLQSTLDRVAIEHCPAGRRFYHAALYDALAAALLLLSLGARPEFREMSLAWLLQMSTRDGEKRNAMQQEDLFG